MAKSTLRHPQFFHTLVPGFHTQLVIPSDFFSKYIQGNTVEVEDTVELKSDLSDKTWKVKMSGRRLSDGWEDFSVDNNLQTGDVLFVKYEGGLVFHVSDLGPDCSQTPSNKSDVIGKTLLKKRLYPTSQVNDDDDKSMEPPRKKKVKRNSSEAEAGSSLSSENSSFVANVTASSLCTDTMYLPEYFTSSSGLTRNSSKIVLIDGGERSWVLDLSFSSSTDTFYISRGWRNFCDENGREAGGFFQFKLVGSGETPILSFCPTEPLSDINQRDCSEVSGREFLSVEGSSEEEYVIECESSEEECSSMESPMEIKKTKNSPKRLSYSSSYSPCRKEFVIFTLPPDYLRMPRLSLPKQFTRENGINKPGKVYLVGEGGKKCLVKLLLHKKHGTITFGKGWKSFLKANDIKTGFTLKLLWKGTTPVLCLCDAEFNIDREQEKSVFIDSSESQLVTLTITPSNLRKSVLRLPKDFTMENDINKPGMITLLGKDGKMHQIRLLFDKSSESMALGGGVKSFVKENGIKIGDSFKLELIWEDTTPVLRLCPAEHSINKRRGCLTPSNRKQFVTLTITPSSISTYRLNLPAQFVRENSMTKPGMMYLVGKDGRKWPMNLRRDTKGTMALSSGWRGFCDAHDLKVGESFQMELIREGAIPMFRWVHTESSSSKVNMKESVSTEPKRGDSSSKLQNQFVTLAPSPEDGSACQLIVALQKSIWFDLVMLMNYWHFNPYPAADVKKFSRFACRVSILDEEPGKWVEVSDLGDRLCCSLGSLIMSQ